MPTQRTADALSQITIIASSTQSLRTLHRARRHIRSRHVGSVVHHETLRRFCCGSSPARLFRLRRHRLARVQPAGEPFFLSRRLEPFAKCLTVGVVSLRTLCTTKCQDDAGPPYLDDEPGIKYHDGSAASPVLFNGECSDPMKTACASREDAKTAYLEGEPNGVSYGSDADWAPHAWRELFSSDVGSCPSKCALFRLFSSGPINCGGNGWYCRIFNDEANGWPNIALNGDLNFAECNKEGAFGGPEDNEDGHCHGSSVDSTCKYASWCDVCPHFILPVFTFRSYDGLLETSL